MVDEASLERYKMYDGKIKDNVHNSIDWEESAILQCENGDCAFLNENKLCDLIIAEGDGILCDTCRLFPRHVEEYEDLREWSMSIACPEIARMMVEEIDNQELVTEEDDEPDPLEDDFDDFDLILFSKLEDAREVMLNIAKNRSLSVSERMGLVLELAGRLQSAYDDDEDFTMDDITDEFRDESYVKENAEEMGISFSGFIREDFKVFDELERLSDDFDDLLLAIKDYPYSTADGENEFVEEVSGARHEVILENLFVSLLFTYFLGSIYNGMIYGYTQMCIFLVIAMDSIALGQSKKLSRKLTMKEYEEIIYRVSRETEHSDLNINAMLEYFDM